ncbi:OmpP1/FadL family transporter [Jannaschia rubra]|uniref:OmpP1/FadL family transporter n=1 Tax=Jannaschia rubra TaxID=282197 RepID=UPI0024904C9E|nr:outer membrane protein transport protein [Jannaschia rubra]
MNRYTLAVLATFAGTATAVAGGLDRSGQDIDILFEEGNYVELSFGRVSPKVDGEDDAAFGGSETGNVAKSYIQGSFGYKQQINDRVSMAIILDQPYGADTLYPTGRSVAFGETTATLNSTSLTGLLRYDFGNRFSVHGGIRAQTIDASVDLRGFGYGPLNGYSADFDGDTAWGYQVGGAYEIPEIALRLAATYFSEIDHDLETTENIGPGAPDTPLTTPKAVNISFQTGIAKDTLVFADFRYSDYKVATVRPRGLGGNSLTDIDTGRDFSIGIGRRFTPEFAASIAFNYSDGGPDDLVSPLAPADGRKGITLAATYQATDAVRFSGGVSYSRVGDARPATAGEPRATFEDNSAVGVGFKVGFSF